VAWLLTLGFMCDLIPSLKGKMYMKILIKTLGCKSNRYESERLFEKLGHEHEIVDVGYEDRVAAGDGADLIIVNTCTVTHVADRKSRQAIRSLKKVAPAANVVVFGCGGRVSGDEYRGMIEVDEVFEEREEVVKYIEDMGKAGGGSEENALRRTRAIVKVQDGCNNYCTYCIIPLARGPEVSFESRRVLEEVRAVAARGYKEIVLTGINIGSWSEEEMDFVDLVNAAMEVAPGVRFRVSSIGPKDCSEKFLNLFENKQFCKHVHMSLQSGSDTVLKRMKRKYSVAEFEKIYRRFVEAVPDIALTTDVIVGFPGETDEEFEETVKFVERMGFMKVHVFPYSKRTRTKAFYMDGQIPDEIKKPRAAKLRDIADRMATDYKKKFLGREMEVLVEKCEDGICNGVTSNYLPVQFSCPKNSDLVNEIAIIKLQKLTKDGNIRGQVAS